MITVLCVLILRQLVHPQANFYIKMWASDTIKGTSAHFPLHKLDVFVFLSYDKHSLDATSAVGFALGLQQCACLGRHSHPNYTNYISFWIAQQDFRVSRLSFSPSLSHWLWSGGTDVRSRGVAMEMGATVAFQEDDAEHRQWLRIRQVKNSRCSQNHQRTTCMTTKFSMKCLQATSLYHIGCQWYFMAILFL